MTHSLPPPFAIITGASRGIGAEYARALAQRGYALLLTARDESRLNALAQELRGLSSAPVTITPMDLAQPNSAQQLYAAAQRFKTPVALLINNAGFGLYGAFFAMPLDRIRAMCQLHVTTTIETVRVFLPDMVRRGSGGIINVSSVAGFFPIPYAAEYAATKAFVLSFSEAVAEEVRDSGVTVQACCPGYTVTEFHDTAGHAPRHTLPPQSPRDVVRASLRAFERGNTRVTVGWQGWLSSVVARYFPRRLLIRMTGSRVRPTE